MPVVNSLPVAHGSGLAAPRASQLDSVGNADRNFAIAINTWLQSHANNAGSATENLLIDAEVHALEVELAWAFAPRLQARVRLGALSNSAGHLDGLISNWHSTFGLPDGDRGDLAQDEFLIAYDSGGVGRAINQSSRGVMDTELSLAYQLIDQPRTSLALHGFVNLATGDPTKLTGSDSADYGVELAYSREFSPKWAAHINLGVVAIGDDALYAIATQSSLINSSVGLHYASSENWRWTAQLDRHSEVFSSSIEELNKPAWLVSLGLEFGERWQVFLAEDLSVNRAADFSLGLRWRSRF